MNNRYCVIMAGGIGSRFWPLSRENKPKQFIDIFGTGKSFLRQTYERFLPIIPVENFVIVTGTRYKDMVLEHIPELSPSQILCEPMRRNTAPCIAFATYHILSKNPDAVIVVAPSDHLITAQHRFEETVTSAMSFAANNDALITIGIKPSRPETGYGYIQAETVTAGGLEKVKTFTEKPNAELAKVFFESGDFFWNSGIFIWSVNSIINALEKHTPEINALFASGIESYNTPEEQAFIGHIYPRCKNVSIDYGIMEFADNVYVSCADLGWSDIGTWGSLYANCEKDNDGNNCTEGEHIQTPNTKNSIIRIPKDKQTIIEGLDGYIVVDTDDALLICRREREQEIRNYVRAE